MVLKSNTVYQLWKVSTLESIIIWFDKSSDNDIKFGIKLKNIVV